MAAVSPPRIDANLVGLVAGFFTTLSSLPQLLRAVRTRSMRDLSPTALGMFTFGVGLWLVYGILIAAPAVTFWNAITFAVYCVLLFLRLRQR